MYQESHFQLHNNFKKEKDTLKDDKGRRGKRVVDDAARNQVPIKTETTLELSQWGLYTTFTGIPCYLPTIVWSFVLINKRNSVIY